MALFPDLTPLVQQIKEFNHNQVRTIQILTEIKEVNSQILHAIKKTN